MSSPALFKLTKPAGGLRRAWFQIITTFLLCFEDDRPCLDGLRCDVLNYFQIHSCVEQSNTLAQALSF